MIFLSSIINQKQSSITPHIESSMERYDDIMNFDDTRDDVDIDAYEDDCMLDRLGFVV